ncbi:MAG: hydroxymethylglutaryl-CoA reductase [Acidobacteriota bacterium]
MSAQAPAARRPALVPRMAEQGYRRDQVDERRAWVENETGAPLEHVGRFTIPSEDWRGNVENPIGAVQMPLGVAGPLHVRGQHIDDVVYVPLATTEGALVRSYERGAVALTRSGGASVRIHDDENRIGPLFTFDDVAASHDFAVRVVEHLDALRAAVAETTRHGRLLRIEPIPAGRRLILNFYFHTGDAQGMNMCVKATDHACRWLRAHLDAPPYRIFSGYNGEKRASGAVLRGGKGKQVVAGACVPRRVVRAVLRTTPEAMVSMAHDTALGHLRAGTLGYNGHVANGLTALFIATGQDVANVANASVAVLDMELTDDGDLYASVTLPSLTVATVGGGTALGTSAECLAMLGCRGTGTARRFAEIAAAMALGGELSMGAAIASGEFVAAHETYGRNRPDASPETRA